MKGKNRLHVNHETMLEAVQQWADATFKVKVKIISVKGGSEGIFELVTGPAEDEPTIPPHEGGHLI